MLPICPSVPVSKQYGSRVSLSCQLLVSRPPPPAVPGGSGGASSKPTNPTSSCLEGSAVTGAGGPGSPEAESGHGESPRRLPGSPWPEGTRRVRCRQKPRPHRDFTRRRSVWAWQPWPLSSEHSWKRRGVWALPRGGDSGMLAARGHDLPPMGRCHPQAVTRPGPGCVWPACLCAHAGPLWGPLLRPVARAGAGRRGQARAGVGRRGQRAERPTTTGDRRPLWEELRPVHTAARGL